MRIELPTGHRSLTSLLRAVLAGALSMALLPAVARADEAGVDQQIEALLGDTFDYKELFYAFQSAVAEGDAETVASLVSYPITVTQDSVASTYADASEFVEYYDDIITPEVRRAVAGQDYGDLFVSGGGIMIGNGEVWINGICDDDSCSQVLPRVVTIQDAD
jgi:hypothetical protein